MKNSNPIHIQTALSCAIDTIAQNLQDCVKNPEKDYSRTRKLSLKTVLCMIIGMGENKLSKELYEWFGYTPDTASVSAFVQQRNKILPNTLEKIFQEFIKLTLPNDLFKGYRLLAVDGSDLRLPTNTKDSFSSISNNEGEKSYNLVHINAMYDVTNIVYVDAIVQGKKGMNEHNAVVSMVDRSTIIEPSIVLMDRGYESFNTIAHFQEKSWNYLIRAKDSYGIISNLALPNTNEFDMEITLTLTRRQTKETLKLLKEHPERYRWIQPHTTFDYIKPKESQFYDLHFRAVRVLISEGVYETIYTNLDKEMFPPETIKALYHMRWGIETSFRDLKYPVGLMSLHSKKMDFMLQEVFAKLIMYNYASLIARKISVPDGKQVNFSVAVDISRQYFKNNLSASCVVELIKKHLSPIRPGRQFERYERRLASVSFQYR